MIFGQGRFTYQYDESWGQTALSSLGIRLAAGIAVIPGDHLLLLTRQDPPIIELDQQGRFVRAIGQGLFTRAHSICRTQDGSFWAVDEGAHALYKFSPDGQLVRSLGTRGHPSDTGYSKAPARPVLRSAGPFNRPTGVAIDSDGCIYVTDGYGNARVHKFSPDGELMLSWGEPGKNPGCFNLPHGISIIRENSGELLYVADRGNNRIQIFDTQGKILDVWNGFIRPASLCFGPDGLIYVSECRQSSHFCDIPSRISIVDRTGKLQARLGEEHPPFETQQGHISAHALAIDSDANLYVAHVGLGWPVGFSGIKKYVPVSQISAMSA